MQISKVKCEEFLANWDNIVWSASRVKEFTNCPLTWYLTYVEGIRGENYYAYTGTLVHSIFEDYYNKGRDLGLDLETVRGVMVKKFKRGQKLNPHPVSFRNAASGDAKIIESLSSFKPIPTITHVERELIFEIRSYKFRAFLDFEEGEYYLGDYKSKWSPDYMNQQYIYMMAKMYNLDRVIGFKCVEYKKMMNVLDFKYEHIEMKETEFWVMETIKTIKKALETQDFPVKEKKGDWFCKNLCMKCEHGK